MSIETEERHIKYAKEVTQEDKAAIAKEGEVIGRARFVPDLKLFSLYNNSTCATLS